MAALTEEQTLIRDQARAWVTEQSPVSKFRKMRDEDAPLSFLEEDWRAMIDMGWSGILVPERYGGSGLGYLPVGIVQEETGRQLTASPLLALRVSVRQLCWLPVQKNRDNVFCLAL